MQVMTPSIIRSKLNNIFFNTLIPYNKRKTKNKNKIKVFTNEEKKCISQE
jgi:hypothetical protein